VSKPPLSDVDNICMLCPMRPSQTGMLCSMHLEFFALLTLPILDISRAGSTPHALQAGSDFARLRYSAPAEIPHGLDAVGK